MVNYLQITTIVIRVEQRIVKLDNNHYLREVVDLICDLLEDIVSTVILEVNNLEQITIMQVQIVEVY